MEAESPYPGGTTYSGKTTIKFFNESASQHVRG
jgi:hypothetical protein